MKINEQLNIALPIRYDDKGPTLYAYHTPISREVYEANYRVLAATKSVLSSKGAHFLMDAGPNIAALTLRDEGRKDAAERGEFDAQGNPLDGGAEALLMELRRLTSVVVPSAKGWDTVPVDVALNKAKIDMDEWKEAESALTFFTCHYAPASRKDRERIAQATASLLGASATSSTLTEWIDSLTTSTTNVASDPKAVLSVPS